jgi:hypothetical protein
MVFARHPNKLRWATSQIGIGIKHRPLDILAEFREVQFCLWQNISVCDPTPYEEVILELEDRLLSSGKRESAFFKVGLRFGKGSYIPQFPRAYETSFCCLFSFKPILGWFVGKLWTIECIELLNVRTGQSVPVCAGTLGSQLGRFM